MKSNVRMEDVAKRAGVARSTVSMALRDDASIPLATRRKIQKVAEAMGYRPNPLVSALMAGLRSGRNEIRPIPLAYVSGFSEAEENSVGTLANFRDGASEHAARLGYRLEYFRLNSGKITPPRLDGILRTRGIPGLLLAPVRDPLEKFDFDWSAFAAVAIGHSLLQPQLHRVVHHQYHGMLLAIENLQRKGYRRPGLVLTTELDQRVDRNWTAAFLVKQMARNGSLNVPLLIVDDLDEETFRQWFERERPDSIISIFPKTVQWTRCLGLLPQEKVGFAFLDWTPETPGPGIDQNSRLVAAAAVDLLVEQLYHNRKGSPKDPKTVLIEGRWREQARPRSGQK